MRGKLMLAIPTRRHRPMAASMNKLSRDSTVLWEKEVDRVRRVRARNMPK